ncbi:hypothetical protein FHS29_005776 [Saccharothrix tamanrassetensis]|uniref:Uncharacterized protein n=1 Tax=Saccharothrix tamanrassetensis TaxID=1051531 RepID=A0A841CUR1_9PSEU|nr:hypothetical protein [Saccharothrix tamanrassetensis]
MLRTQQRPPASPSLVLGTAVRLPRATTVARCGEPALDQARSGLVVRCRTKTRRGIPAGSGVQATTPTRCSSRLTPTHNAEQETTPNRPHRPHRSHRPRRHRPPPPRSSTTTQHHTPEPVDTAPPNALSSRAPCTAALHTPCPAERTAEPTALPSLATNEPPRCSTARPSTTAHRPAASPAASSPARPAHTSAGSTAPPGAGSTAPPGLGTRCRPIEQPLTLRTGSSSPGPGGRILPGRAGRAGAGLIGPAPPNRA